MGGEMDVILEGIAFVRVFLPHQHDISKQPRKPLDCHSKLNSLKSINFFGNF